MVELINHDIVSNLIFRKNPIQRVFPNPITVVDLNVNENYTILIYGHVMIIIVALNNLHFTCF